MNPKIWELLCLKVSADNKDLSAAIPRIVNLGVSGMTFRSVSKDELEAAEDHLEVYMRFVDEHLLKAGIENIYYPKPGCFDLCKKAFCPEEKPLRKLDIGTNRFTEVAAMDEPSEVGACHEYRISLASDDKITPLNTFGAIHFQKGPVKEVGVNGCYQEDLIAIVIDRLRGFQSGEFACRENALALTKFQEGLHWLEHRTRARIAQGVEGTNQHRS